jgi:hypothetical protein
MEILERVPLQRGPTYVGRKVAPPNSGVNRENELTRSRPVENSLSNTVVSKCAPQHERRHLKNTGV